MLIDRLKIQLASHPDANAVVRTRKSVISANVVEVHVAAHHEVRQFCSVDFSCHECFEVVCQCNAGSLKHRAIHHQKTQTDIGLQTETRTA